MYLDDSSAAIQKLSDHVTRGGVLSILTKNALSSGFREALRGDYTLARQLIETGAASSIGNLGISTRGDDPSTIIDLMKRCGFDDCQWRGIRIFSDHLDADSFDANLADALIALEQAASMRDPVQGNGPAVSRDGPKGPVGLPLRWSRAERSHCRRAVALTRQSLRTAFELVALTVTFRPVPQMTPTCHPTSLTI